jgi:hypothetical protein
MLGVGLSLVTPLNHPAGAVTRDNRAADRTISICIDTAPPGMFPSTARARLNDAIATWETTGGIDGVPGVDFTHDNPCRSGTDIRVTTASQPGGVYATASTTQIRFDNDGDLDGTSYSWWTGIGSRPAHWPSFEGVLVHEMGHTVGIGHSGNALWSDDGSPPSMNTCGSPTNTVAWETIERDDWGSAVNIGALATNKPTFLNANPGFERSSSHWQWSGSVAVAGAYAKSSAYGARMATSGSFMWAGASYDAYTLSNNSIVAATNMDQGTVTLTLTSYVRDAFVDTTGGLRLKYNQRIVDYPGGDNCKASGAVAGSWAGQVTTTPDCFPSTFWSLCSRNIQLSFNATNAPARMIRPLFQSTASGAIYLDRTGITGGTQ